MLAENGAGVRPANELVLANDRREPMTTPSAQRSGITLIHPFEVKAGQVVDLTLGFDACKSIVLAGNSGRDLLKPTIAVIPMTNVGRIVGAVPAGSRVSAQVAAPGGSPDTVKTTTADSSGRFVRSPLPARARDPGCTVVVTTAGTIASVIGSVPVVAQADTAVSRSPRRGPSVARHVLAGHAAGRVALRHLAGGRARVGAAALDRVAGACGPLRRAGDRTRPPARRLARARRDRRAAAGPGRRPRPVAAALTQRARVRPRPGAGRRRGAWHDAAVRVPNPVPPEPACRPGCGACCIAPSIATPMPGMPRGKPAGVRCLHLDEALRCLLFGRPERPSFCAGLRPSREMCGEDRRHAITWLDRLERLTAPRARDDGS